MDTPRYTVTITSLTRGWTHTVTQGDVVDRNVSLHLTDTFSLDWTFQDEQIPGQLEPMRVTFGFAAFSTADLPAMAEDDLVSVRVCLGASGPDLVNLLACRVAVPEVTLRPQSVRAAVMSVTAVDLLADLRGRLLTAASTGNSSDRARLRQRYALAGAQLGRSIGVPAAWDDEEHANSLDSVGTGTLTYFWPEKNADKFLESLSASWSPDGIHHTVTPHYGWGYPTGYEWCGPSGTGSPWSGIVPQVDPNSLIKFLMTPAGRTLADAAPLPLRFVVEGGLLTLTEHADADRLLVLDAAWCKVPAVARRSREHVIDTVDIGGVEPAVVEAGTEHDAYEEPDIRRVVTNAVDSAPRRARAVDTQLRLSTYTRSTDVHTTDSYQAANIEAVADVFLTDPTADATPWAFDEFLLTADPMSQAEAEDVLPRIVPSYPGDGRDGRVVRHLTIRALPPEVRFDGMPVVGFVVRGSMTIQRGHLEFTLTTAPGMPSPLLTSPVTVGEVDAASYQATLVSAIDPLITVADLAYVAA